MSSHTQIKCMNRPVHNFNPAPAGSKKILNFRKCLTS